MKNIQYTESDLSKSHTIKRLWQQLNEHHRQNSIHHKDHFSSFTFEQRIDLLRRADSVRLFSAELEGRVFGYCISSISGDTAEIDSLYIETEMRQSGAGSRLLQLACNWLKSKNIRKITISVAHGNESVIPFYHKHGFREKLIHLTREI